MAFPPNLLTDDEELVLDLRPHWWYIAPASALLAVSLIIGLIVLVSAGDGGAWSVLRFVVGLGVLGALVNFALSYAKWSTTNFVVTNERVISRTGVVAKKGIEIPLDRINTVFFEQGLFERMIGAGSLGIESAGEGGRQTFTDVRKPNMVQQEIYRQKDVYEESRLRRLTGIAPAAAAPPAGPTIPDQIAQLDELRKSGAITEDEFQEKKAELLRRL